MVVPRHPCLHGISASMHVDAQERVFYLAVNKNMMTELLVKPQPPADGECCDSACDVCVWDNYYAERKKWRLQQVALKEQLAKEKDLKE